jgi:four helix bundle protein
MARPKSYRDLIVWQKAMELARQIYLLSQGLPKNEAYGLLTQMRRAAVSVPSNIAEGHGRLTDSQFRHFLGNARGSLYEVQTQVELAGNLGYFDENSIRELMDRGLEVARLMNGLITVLGKQDERLTGARTSSANTANSADKDSTHEDTH